MNTTAGGLQRIYFETDLTKESQMILKDAGLKITDIVKLLNGSSKFLKTEQFIGLEKKTRAAHCRAVRAITYFELVAHEAVGFPLTKTVPLGIVFGHAYADIVPFTTFSALARQGADVPALYSKATAEMTEYIKLRGEVKLLQEQAAQIKDLWDKIMQKLEEKNKPNK